MSERNNTADRCVSSTDYEQTVKANPVEKSVNLAETPVGKSSIPSEGLIAPANLVVNAAQPKPSGTPTMVSNHAPQTTPKRSLYEMLYANYSEQGANHIVSNANEFFPLIDSISCFNTCGAIKLTVNDYNQLRVSHQFLLVDNNIIVPNDHDNAVEISLPRSIIAGVRNGTIKTTMNVRNNCGEISGIIILPGSYSVVSGSLTRLQILTPLAIQGSANCGNMSCNSPCQRNRNTYHPIGVRSVGTASLTSYCGNVSFGFAQTN